jgi:hypothetical protein
MSLASVRVRSGVDPLRVPSVALPAGNERRISRGKWEDVAAVCAPAATVAWARIVFDDGHGLAAGAAASDAIERLELLLRLVGGHSAALDHQR